MSEIAPAIIAPRSGRKTIASYISKTAPFSQRRTSTKDFWLAHDLFRKLGSTFRDHASALHQIHVFDRDRAAIAVIGDEDGKPDGSFRRGYREHDQGIDLPDDVAEKGRECDEIDVHGEQDELDRHQNNDDVFAVEENSENPEREQDGADRQVVSEPDDHDSPCPDFTLTISIALVRRRAPCSAITCRRT